MSVYKSPMTIETFTEEIPIVDVHERRQEISAEVAKNSGNAIAYVNEALLTLDGLAQSVDSMETLDIQAAERNLALNFTLQLVEELRSLEDSPAEVMRELKLFKDLEPIDKQQVVAQLLTRGCAYAAYCASMTAGDAPKHEASVITANQTDLTLRVGRILSALS